MRVTTPAPHNCPPGRGRWPSSSSGPRNPDQPAERSGEHTVRASPPPRRSTFLRVNAYAAPSAGEPLSPITIERRAVGANDVLIAIEYAGICHSDIHTV